ncbi:hypothetical protein [Lacticaseibacillus absianus]|uniref:hypothetical protein n=1 Tax=Lacticaseibacillus absianus TaxID=2729623 RepID=UPI0015C7E3BA|nr:hypothetical protein [Lacticaseibacillus absianus]
MGLFAKLKAWWRARPTTTTPPAAVPVTSRQQPTPAPEPPTGVPLPPATGTPATNVHVTVYFYVRDHTRDLRPPLQLSGHTGAPLPLVPPVIEGFALAEVVGFTTTFPVANQSIFCLYRPCVAAPVLVYHRDTHGRLLTPPVILAGALHAHFIPTPLAELADHLMTPPLAGRFTTVTQTRTLRYDLDPLVPSQAPEAAYVELLAAKAAYAQPDLTAPLATPLPAGSYWRVFALARDQDGTVWLNIGGSQWLTAAQTRPQAHDPFRLPPAPLRLPDAAFAYTMTPTTRQATVTATVSQWTAPYGTVEPGPVSAGTLVQLTHTAIASNGSRWVRLASGLYIQAEYLD